MGEQRRFSGTFTGIATALVAVLCLTLGVGPAEAFDSIDTSTLLHPRQGLDPLDSPGSSSESHTETWGEFRDEPVGAQPIDPDESRPVVPSLSVEELLKLTPSSRDATTDYFTLPDGTSAAVISDQPKNMETAPGVWERIDTSVVQDRSTGGLKATRHPMHPEFGKDATGGYQVTIGTHTVTFGLIGTAKTEAVIETAKKHDAGTGIAIEGRDAVTYPSVLPGVDLDFEVNPSGVKELLVLGQDSDDTVFRWKVTAPGLTSKVSEYGDFEFYDERGTLVFAIPAPRMWDSSGVEGKSEPASSIVEAELESTNLKNGEFELILRPSLKWLQDSKRVFPIFVDPTLTMNPNLIRGFKSDGATANDRVRVGNPGQPQGPRYWRTVVGFNYSSLITANRQVTGAAMSGSRLDGTANGYNTSIYVASCTGYNCLGTYLTYYWTTTSFGGGSTEPLGRQFAAWVEAGQSGKTLILRGGDVNAYSYKGLSIQLVIWYKAKPAIANLKGGDGGAPTNGASHAPLRPWLHADLTLDSAVQYPTLRYYLAKASDATTAQEVKDHAIFASEWVDGKVAYHVPAGVLEEQTEYVWTAEVRDEYYGLFEVYPTGTTNQVFSFTTQQPSRVSQGSAVPADESIVSTLTPTLSVGTATNPDGDTMPAAPYRFTIGTGPQPGTGTVVSSGWLSSPTWQVPTGVLQDGGVYSWGVEVDDGTEPFDSGWANSFKVDLRLGAAGPSPTDSAGPVTVNLATGNASLSFPGPSIQTMGGPIGMTFSYNSGIETRYGLTGSYYLAQPPGASTEDYSFDGKTPVLVRLDAVPGGTWNAETPPSPAIPYQKFMVRWEGKLKISSADAGSYKPWLQHSLGARVFIKAEGTSTWTTWYDQWDTAKPDWTITDKAAVNLTAGIYDIRVEFRNTDLEQANLGIRLQKGTEDPFAIPPSWLTPKTQILPAGWSSSTPLAGLAGYYTSAKISERSVVFTDVTGGTHTYTRVSDGGWKAPTGEYATVSKDELGGVSLTEEDGTVYTFTPTGQVAGVSSPTDARKPVNPVLQYASDGRLSYAADPLSKVGGNYYRKVTFSYQPASGNGGCSVPSGFSPAPIGMLCAITYPPALPGGSSQRVELLYDSSGNLVRLVYPGNAIADFQYDGQGRLVALRDAGMNDWLLADAGRDDETPAVFTQVSYNSSGRVDQVTLPAPDGVTVGDRPAKTYSYLPFSSGIATTFVDVVGLSLPGGSHAATVTYDEAFRKLSATSAMGYSSELEWSQKDQLLSVTDVDRDLKSTTIFDDQDRATDAYGPAPASCFDANREPLGTCPITPAHTSTEVDGGLVGLAVSYFPNANFAGLPVRYSDGLETIAGGALDRNWATAAPIVDWSGYSADGWSLSATGLITFPESGEYRFGASIEVKDSVRIYLDNIRVLSVDSTTTGVTTVPADGLPITATAGQRMRIRVQFADREAAAKLQLLWKKPSDSGLVAVPGSSLSPDYGLITRTTLHDEAPSGGGVSSSQLTDLVTGNSYDNPWLGLLTASTIDPGGLALTTVITYESPTDANGHLRRLGRYLPAAVEAAGTNPPSADKGTTSVYYGDTDTVNTWGQGAICGVPTSTRQYGFLKTITGPTAGTGPGSEVSIDYVYDYWGRTVGTKRSGDTAWSCLALDARGRIIQTDVSAKSPDPSRTLTVDYQVASSLVAVETTETINSTPPTSVTTSVTTDLLGRVVSSTDYWGTETATTYESQTGRVLTVTTNIVGASPVVESFEYDADGKVEKVKLNSVTVADPAYDPNTGLLQGVVYGNGTQLTGLVRDDAGRGVSQSFEFPGQDSVTESVVRSQSGRILKTTLEDGAVTRVSDYTFDAAGRLIQAVIPDYVLQYQFAASGSCGVNEYAGLDGNRTQLVSTFQGGTPLVTDYCYDYADRLTSTEVSAAVSGSNPVTAGLASQDLAYDGHGNTVRLADQELVYDVQDRHTATILDSGDRVTYLRDASGSIVSRTQTIGTATDTYRYSTGGVESVLDDAGNLLQYTLSLPGAVTVTVKPTGELWSYGIYTATRLSLPTGRHKAGGEVRLWPVRATIDPTTGLIGTTTADEAAYSDNLPGMLIMAIRGSIWKL
ncbi:MAG: hypothetical protein KF772_01065 [Cryobacterium sp.]|nr:hypothetical protein [Cryobacterium sp.]